MSKFNTFDVLYNPLANNSHGKRAAEQLNVVFSGRELHFHDMTEIEDLNAFVQSSKHDIILCGGDGTLSRFVNTVDCDALEKPVYLFATGTGNDFMHDVNDTDTDMPLRIDGFLKNLPVVTVNGKTMKFFNGVGFGVDGYCCEIADKIKAQDPGAKINYTTIAINGLLREYKSKTATVIIDGVERTFENVWIASTLKGRYYGGGMMMAPSQDRKIENEVSIVVYHSKSKMIALSTFPKVFKGSHVSSTDVVTVFRGRNVTVRFNEPSALQVDGETFLDVTEYSVKG